MLSELLENEVLSVAFYGEETDWNSGCVFFDADNTHAHTRTHHVHTQTNTHALRKNSE